MMIDENQAVAPSLADTVFAAFGQETPDEYRPKPTEAPQEQAPEPEVRDDGRDEKGRFAPKKDDAVDDGKPADAPKDSVRSEGEGKKPDEGNGEPLPPSEADGSTPVSPPPGWSIASKAAWDELPAAVRADIAKREAEVSDGFKQYQGLKEVIPYQQHYASQGASVKQALDAYTEVDRLLAKDFTTGMIFIAQQKQINPVHMAMAILQKHGVQLPENAGQQPQARPQQQFQDPRVDQILQQIESDKRAREQQEEQSAQQTLQQFAADPANKYFENVKVTMGRLIQTGEATDLQDAYQKATWANPEIRALLIKEQQAKLTAAQQPQRQAQAAAQARQAARGITGSPMPGATSGGPKPKLTDRELIAESLRAQGVSV